ncbi:MAG: hypothetical protein ACTSX6_10590 [Candidatus Heimdallarchaeaceae archaeon]
MSVRDLRFNFLRKELKRLGRENKLLKALLDIKREQIKMLQDLIDLFASKCRFHKICEYYNPASKVCSSYNANFGYCGKYREFAALESLRRSGHV